MPDYKEEIQEQFRVSYNKVNGAFYVLDLWNPAVVNLPPDADIPENSPALKVISALEINALLGKLKEMGWLDKFITGGAEPTNNIVDRPIRKSLAEIAIENVAQISVEKGVDNMVIQQAINAIREIVNKA